MADLQIDVCGDDGEFEVSNPQGFDLRITGCGLSLEVTHEQARSMFDGLRPYFDDTTQERK